MGSGCKAFCTWKTAPNSECRQCSSKTAPRTWLFFGRFLGRSTQSFPHDFLFLKHLDRWCKGLIYIYILYIYRKLHGKAMCTLIFLRDIHRHMHLGLDVRSVLSLIVKTGVNGSPVRLGKIRLAVQSVTKRSTNRMSTLLRRLCLNRSSEQIQCQTLVPWAQVNRFSACRVMSGVLRQLKDKDLCLGCHCTKPINFLRCTPCTQVRFNGFCWTTTVSSIGPNPCVRGHGRNPWHSHKVRRAICLSFLGEWLPWEDRITGSSRMHRISTVTHGPFVQNCNAQNWKKNTPCAPKSVPERNLQKNRSWAPGNSFKHNFAPHQKLSAWMIWKKDGGHHC